MGYLLRIIKKSINLHMKNKYYIDYPQEKIEPNGTEYQCEICKVSSLKINGLIENHNIDCSYRIQKEKLQKLN